MVLLEDGSEWWVGGGGGGGVVGGVNVLDATAHPHEGSH